MTLFNDIVRDDAGVNEELDRILNSPNGSIWMVVLFRLEESGELGGHIQPVVNTSRGTVAIPVNAADAEYDLFVEIMQPLRSRQSLREILSDEREIVAMSAIQVTTRNAFEGNLSALLSFFDCSGDGAGAIGSLMPLNSHMINQCESGFCY